MFRTGLENSYCGNIARMVSDLEKNRICVPPLLSISLNSESYDSRSG